MKKWFFIPLLAAGVMVTMMTNCRRPDPYNEHRYLAEKYCISCHAFPEPDLLSTSTWQEILPRMGARMGIAITADEISHAALLRATDLFPPTSLLSEEEWRMIQQYYLDLSPDSLVTTPTAIRGEQSDLFREHPIRLGDTKPEVSLVKFGLTPEKIFMGNALEQKVYEYNLEKDSAATYELDGAPSDIQLYDDHLEVLTMGNIHPNDQAQGKIFSIYDAGTISPIIYGLPRPVHAVYDDLNNDDLTDIVVSGFGYLRGGLAYYQNSGSGHRLKILHSEPGPLKTVVCDLNEDGNKDLLVLIAQGDEGFYYFRGDGTGNFRKEQLIRFPSAWGSSYFEFRDFNGDGKEDILYVNGDNGDYSTPVIKPYHGLRIYLNESRNDEIRFEETWYFRMNGPFKAMAEDYDLDGDLDIACLSYFPDYTHTPEEAFLFLENEGSSTLSFEAFSVPASLKGKWLVADRKDFDGDGDIDILLGNNQIMSLNVPEAIQAKWKALPLDMLLLENTAANR